ncbi:hypothetical protein LCGC14_0372790 [marine sediment metagenome]|uniref:Uncharacterized protein n=1 Tax=marine sediment metagenome TaxID=412755 RepID=A0A0F9WDE7_9ZZZZ
MAVTPKLQTISPKLSTTGVICATKQRKAGILIPQCPPKNTIEINGPQDYYLWAWYSREPQKATYDLLFREDI